jgi:large subunit ribosomal protein L30
MFCVLATPLVPVRPSWEAEVGKLRVVLRRGCCGVPRRQLDCVAGLGLRRVGSQRLLSDTPAIRGMVRRVLHLVDVVEVADGE